MTIEIVVPDIGSDEVEVTEILVNIGDSVQEEQSLILVEGDKASMEIPAPCSGKIKEIMIAVGDKVATGSLIMFFDENTEQKAEEKGTNADNTAPAAKNTAVENKDIHLPDIGSDEVEITEILVAIGSKIELEQPLIIVEGDKASMEIPAPFAGKVKDIKVAVGDKLVSGSLIMSAEIASKSEIETELDFKADEPLVSTETRPLAQIANSDEIQIAKPTINEFEQNEAYVHASPMVRRIAREFGINLEKVRATGPKNRIQKEDVQDYVKAAMARLESGSAANLSNNAGLGLLPWPKVDFAKFGEVEIKPLGKITKLSGANLARNWVMIPHVTQFDHADITELEAFRQEQNAIEAKKSSSIKITPLVFVLKAVAKTLEAFPHFNSSLSEDGENLILKKYINLGVAVDTPNGLVVPVFRSVNTKGIYELSAELAATSAKARDGKLMTSDMQGGSFTISSLGGIGGTAFTPIVNAPEVAILGVSKSEMKPVWNGKEFVPRLQLPLSLSYDHRVIDGAEGARFITYLNQCLSDIRRLIL